MKNNRLHDVVFDIPDTIKCNNNRAPLIACVNAIF